MAFGSGVFDSTALDSAFFASSFLGGSSFAPTLGTSCLADEANGAAMRADMLRKRMPSVGPSRGWEFITGVGASRARGRWTVKRSYRSMISGKTSRREGVMAPLSVEGIYKDGRVEFLERPVGMTDGARVRVTLVDAGSDGVDAESREALRQRAFVQMRKGIDLGGSPYPTREEIYDERIRELGRRRGV